MPESADRESQKRQERLMKLLQAGNSGGYERVAKRLREARELFHEEVAHQIEKPLNDHLSEMPRENLQEKQALAKWLNAEMRYLGIAIKDPRLGRATFIRGNPASYEGGRFQLCLCDEPKLRAAVTIKDIFPMKFMGNPDRHGRLKEREDWQSRVSKPGKDSSPAR